MPGKLEATEARCLQFTPLVRAEDYKGLRSLAKDKEGYPIYVS